MVCRRLLLYDVPQHTMKNNPWDHIWLTIGHGSGITLRIESDIDADTFMDLASTSIGSLLLQDLIGETSEHNIAHLNRICLEHALYLATHWYGSFVVMKLVQESTTPAFVSDLCYAFVGEISSLAMHRCGSRVLERIIENCDCTQVDFFFDEFVLHSPQIVRHKYGNYVVQRMLEHGPQLWRRRCLLSILDSAPFIGKSNIFVRCALSATYIQSEDEFIIRTLRPLFG